MAQDCKTRLVLDPKYDQALITELECYANEHTRGNVTQAARELMAKGLVKEMAK